MTKTITCPQWCVLNHIDADVDPVDESSYHSGPVFGGLRVAGILSADGTVRELTATTDECSYYTPTELRGLAAEALAAAEWLERETGV